MYKKTTLRGKITEAKAEYLKEYGCLDWHWYDEGLVWTIQDYHSSVGSILDFTVDDLRVCSANGFSAAEVIDILCEGDVSFGAESFFGSCLERYNQQADKSAESTFEIPLGYLLKHMIWYYTEKQTQKPSY